MSDVSEAKAFVASLDAGSLVEFVREATLELSRRRDVAYDAEPMKPPLPPIERRPKPPALEPEPSLADICLRSTFPIQYFAEALSDLQLREYASAITSELLGRGLLESHIDDLTDRQVHKCASVIASKLITRGRDFAVAQKIISSLAEKALESALQFCDPRFTFNLLRSAVATLHKEPKFTSVIRSAESVPVIYSPFGLGTDLEDLKQIVGSHHWQNLRGKRAKSLVDRMSTFLAHRILGELGAVRSLAQAETAILKDHPQLQHLFERLPKYAPAAKALPEFRKGTAAMWFDAAWAAVLESTNGQPERVREWDPVLRNFGIRKGVTAEQAIKDDLKDAIERLAPA